MGESVMTESEGEAIRRAWEEWEREEAGIVIENCAVTNTGPAFTINGDADVEWKGNGIARTRGFTPRGPYPDGRKDEFRDVLAGEVHRRFRRVVERSTASGKG